MRVVFFGTPQFAVSTLEKLVDTPDIEVVAVVTQPDKKRARGNDLIPSAVKQFALDRNIPVWQPARIKKDEETLDRLARIEVDFFVVVAYGQILSRQILEMPKLGCINVHGSILPKYRGAAPIQWSIDSGDDRTGITTMLMDEGMDTGAMLLTAYTPISLLDNSQIIATKLAKQGADLLVDTLSKLAKKEIVPIPQDDREATHARLINKEDYLIDWGRTNLEIHNRIRAFYPDCKTTFRDKQLKVLATIPLGEEYWQKLPPEYQKLAVKYAELSFPQGKSGEIVGSIDGFGAVVQTGRGLLLLERVQLAGKNALSGNDFVNGMRVVTGEILN
jgi:methionyl-tRNA formyltransferase